MITTQTGPQPADFTDVRATNLAVVLKFVRVNAPCSRADIAASTGLNKTTVSSLVGELIDRRLLRETGLTEHRIGRPATMIVMDGAPYAAIGLEVSTDYLAAVAMDLAGDRLLSWRRSYPGGSGGAGTGGARRAVAAVAALARRAVTRARDEGREVLGVSVGVPGLVDADGSVRLATNLGWAEVPLRADLLEALGDPAYPVTVENDANLAATAEYRYGPHAGAANLVYLTGQLGIGAGIIADGRPLRGTRGYSGELGHIPVDPAGPVCSCGRRGCLEAVAGIGALLDRLGLGVSAPLTDVEPAVEEVTRRAQHQDPAVLSALTDLGRQLGVGVSILANLVNPEVVILGGYYVPLAPWLLPAAEQALRDGTLAPAAGGCQLVASTLGHSAAAIGGAAGVLDSVDSGQLPVAAHR